MRTHLRSIFSNFTHNLDPKSQHHRKFRAGKIRLIQIALEPPTLSNFGQLVSQSASRSESVHSTHSTPALASHISIVLSFRFTPRTWHEWDLSDFNSSRAAFDKTPTESSSGMRFLAGKESSFRQPAATFPALPPPTSSEFHPAETMESPTTISAQHFPLLPPRSSFRGGLSKFNCLIWFVNGVRGRHVTQNCQFSWKCVLSFLNFRRVPLEMWNLTWKYFNW